MTEIFVIKNGKYNLDFFKSVVSSILPTGNVGTSLSNFLGQEEKKIRIILAASAFFNMKCANWTCIDFPKLEKSKFYFQFFITNISIMRDRNDSKMVPSER